MVQICKGNDSLEDDRPLEVDNNQLRKIIEADPLLNTWEVAEDLSVDHSIVDRHLKYIGRVKKKSGCLMNWPKKEKKKITAKWHLLFYAATVNHFLIGLWCVMKSGFYMTTSNEQLSGWTKKNLQRQTCTHTKKKKKKKPGHCLVVCCPSNPLQLSEFWKYHYIQEVCSGNLRCTKNFKTCSQQWSTERGQIFSKTTPPMHSTTNASEVEWSTKLCLIHHIHLTSCLQTTMSSSILTTFCR